MSKTKRKDLRRRRREQQATSMLIDGVEDPNMSQTDSEDSADSAINKRDLYHRPEEDDPMILDAQRRIGAGLDGRGRDVYGYRRDQYMNPAECDSDLEDLLELERIELARRQKPSNDSMRKV